MNASEPQLECNAARLDDDANAVRLENARLARALAASKRDSADQRRLRVQSEARQASETARLESALAAAQATARLYERSPFWRITAPLRAIVNAVRSLDGPRRAFPQKSELAPLPALRPRAGLARAITALDIASSPAPRVSVLVPTHGHPLHLCTCLAAIAREATAIALEVIVMDDCGDIPAREALAEVSGVRFERSPVNLGYVGACNRAARLARGEFLLFLNDDAVMAPGTVRALLQVFADDRDTGAVGAKLVYPDGRLQEAGAIVWRDGTAWNYGRGDDPARPEYNYRREVDYCSAACLMVARAVFENAGGFDELYAPAYCEDTDLCFKVREAGLRVWYQPAAEVVHFEGVSHGTDVASGAVKRFQVENQAKLRTRWGAVLAAHRPPGVFPRLERERSARRRILFIEEGMLTPDQDSGSLRTFRLMREMKKLGCHVTFVPGTLEAGQPATGQLQECGIEVLHAPYFTSVEGILEERGAEFDIVVLARHAVAARHMHAVRRHAPATLLVFDTIDLHHERERQRAALEQDAYLALEAGKIRQQELDCMRGCDVTWVVSAREQEVLAREVPGAVVHVQTNIHETVGDVAPFETREGLIFVGGFRHPPNVDAAKWLGREIWPLLKDSLPGVPLYLVGSAAPAELQALAAGGVTVVGQVPDVAPWLDRCRVALSPLRYGAGVKGKINHAMSRGLPVVATSISIEGMHLAPGVDVLLADDPAGFCREVTRLYRDEALWNRLSCGGRANVERHFSPQVAAASLQALFEWADERRGC